MSGAFIEGRPPSQAQVDGTFARRLTVAMNSASTLTVAAAKRRMPVRSGEASRATLPVPARVIVISPGVLELTGGVFNLLRRVAWLEHGTGIYGPLRRPITPTTARVLRWPDRGHASYRKNFTLTDRLRTRATNPAYAYSPSVRGIQPMHIFRDAVAEVRLEVGEIFRLAGRSIAHDIQLMTGVKGTGL